MQNYKSDEEFERYLKGFRPLPPGPLPRRIFRLVFPRFTHPRAIYATAIVLLVATAILIHVRVPPLRAVRQAEGEPVRSAPSAPLTMQKADLLLASDVSYRVAVEGLIHPTHSPVLPPRHQRAFAVLAEQKGLR